MKKGWMKITPENAGRSPAVDRAADGGRHLRREEAVIFTGIQASGKTTFYLQRFFETHVRLSLDMLKTRRRESLLLEACIRAGQSFVVDNTNVLKEQRAEYVRRARVRPFRLICFFFEPDVERAIAWNNQRHSGAIPIKGLLATLRRMERPTREEGFDELYRVQINETGDFVVDASET